MPSVWQALGRGESARERRLLLARAHERFLMDRSELVADEDLRRRFAQSAGMRSVVFDSWLRSGEQTVDPDVVPAGPGLTDERLEELRATASIGRVVPVLERLLVEQAAEAGFIVAVGDASGRLLWVDGDHGVRARAEDMGFRAGMDWSEAAVGTSAPGSALALRHSIQVLGAEHFNRFVHQWSCTAAPVHDPVSGSLIGVIDVTGGDELASPHIMPMVEATLAAVSAELRLEAIRRQLAESSAGGQGRAGDRERGKPRRRASTGAAGPAEPHPDGRVRLVLLGREPATLEFGGDPVDVAGRHAEILLALAEHPHGLSASELAEHVYGDAGSPQTLRAEVVRLRRRLADRAVPLTVESRPYRLSASVRVDARDLLSALGRGAHRIALAAYEGPALPGSDAPVAEALRREVATTLRESMLQDAAADPLYDYARHWAHDDGEVWRTLLGLLPPRSPKRALAVAALETLEE